MKKILLLVLIGFGLTGCAVNTRYVGYTAERYPAKSKYYFVNIYTASPPSTQPYWVIGRVETSGYASDGVNQDTVTDQAKAIARKRGADAIINAKTIIAPYSKVAVMEGYTSYHRHWAHYHPTEYIPYSDTLITFRGELIVFNYKNMHEHEGGNDHEK